MSKKLTIGITTYNCYPFIEELIYNIDNQFKINPKLQQEIDIILIDDCSTEPEMVNYLRNIPQFIRVKKNSKNSGGPSTARNYLIENVETEYILFIDGDDNFVCKLDDLLFEIKEISTDVFISDVVKILSDGIQGKSPFLYSEKLFSQKKETPNLKKMVVHQTGIWSIYSVDFLRKKNLKYELGIRYEDNFFMTNLFLKDPRVAILNVKYYGWRNNYSSFSYGEDSFDKRIDIYEKILTLLSSHSEHDYAPWLFYSIWNQTYVNIIRGYPVKKEKQYKVFYSKLEIITNNNSKTIKNFLSRLDGEYIDAYTKLRRKLGVKKYTYVYLIRKVAAILRSKSKIKFNVMRGFCVFPINEKKIFITSHYGKYNDNSKYEYIKMRQNPLYDDYKIIFAVKDKKLAKQKDFINYNNFILFFYHHYTAKKIIFNSWYNPNIIKRKSQIWIQLWHGIPYKKIHTDIETYDITFDEKKKIERQSSINNYDIIYSVNDYNTRIFKKLFPKAEIIKKEYAKVEWVVNNKNDKEKILLLKKKYNLDQNERYILYAPTYRPYTVFLDFSVIVKMAQKADAKLIIHFHPMMKYYWMNKEKESTVPTILDYVEDIQELILCMDILISDYSSIIYDFKKMNKNILYYKPDESLYRKIHGLYIPSLE